MSQPYQQRKEKPKKFWNCLWFFHSANWKREEILDHSFNLINVNDYVNKSAVMRIKYLWIFFSVFRIIMVYLFDLYLLFQAYHQKDKDKYSLKNGSCSLELYNFNSNYLCTFVNYKFIQTLIKNMFWLLLFSIAVGTLLGFLELKKAQKIIKSQDISFAYTNLVAYRYYCIKSYAYYCFFQLIQNHKKFIDNVAFFIFFTFKGMFII